ncbi:hypothetical protein GWK41_10015 [Persephonella atlantica]|uniref:Uncharacterized protein n=1 Tax=Persephonella atlantica TaxID=2699429 RepID=A0ABS1GKC3_9AQUI|nr:hypothetical protein [Persephonella atlantica]MBK3333399.1 hypothetical protein [Persephonella atlantica]
MHISGRTALQLNGCDWHSVVLDNSICIAYEKDELDKIYWFKNEVLNNQSQGFKFIPSLSGIFGDTHLIEKKADDFLPFDYVVANCIRAYVELVNYLLLKGSLKTSTISGKTAFLFTIYQFLFDVNQEKEIFFYLEKLHDSLDNPNLKFTLKEFIEFNKEELANV